MYGLQPVGRREVNALVRVARTVSGGPVLWLIMTVMYAVNTVVLFTTYGVRDIVDYVLALLNPLMLLAAVFITGVKLYDRRKERRGAEKPHA